MKQTEHYGLNQWELADRIRMEDFNGDNEKVDAALKGQAEALAAEIKTVQGTLVYIDKSPKYMYQLDYILQFQHK